MLFFCESTFKGKCFETERELDRLFNSSPLWDEVQVGHYWERV
jgi:hypothetical protein